MTVERYPHVSISFRACEGGFRDVDCFDALMACFCGHRLRRPKVRAMEIIEEVERTRRGIYAGGVHT
jgi:anthranilate synthase component 1